MSLMANIEINQAAGLRLRGGSSASGSLAVVASPVSKVPPASIREVAASNWSWT